MFDYTKQSVNSAMTPTLVRALKSILLVNKNGTPILDDTGHPKSMNTSIVMSDILNNFQDVLTSDDIIPKLKKLSKDKSWARSIIRILENTQENNSEFASPFYATFRKDLTNYFIVKTNRNADNSYSYNLMSANEGS